MSLSTCNVVLFGTSEKYYMIPCSIINVSIYMQCCTFRNFRKVLHDSMFNAPFIQCSTFRNFRIVLHVTFNIHSMLYFSELPNSTTCSLAPFLSPLIIRLTANV